MTPEPDAFVQHRLDIEFWLHRERQRPVGTEEEWLERSAVESETNVEVQWLRTFAAADADPMNLRHTYSPRPELNR